MFIKKGCKSEYVGTKFIKTGEGLEKAKLEKLRLHRGSDRHLRIPCIVYTNLEAFLSQNSVYSKVQKNSR